MASTTRFGEQIRQISNLINAPHDQIQVIVGIVSQVHPKKPRLIKAYNANDFTSLANDNWIELNHSAQEIVERWGTIRPGFRVRIMLRGPTGIGADAIVIGTESQDVEEPYLSNEVARSLWAIFTPGIGG